MSDSDFLRDFEAVAIAPGSFHHEDHVRMAFLYLQRHDLFDALSRVRVGLKRLVERFGAHDKYHETVTCALVLVIHERMEQRPTESTSWPNFAASNPDLLAWKDGPFFDYYDAAVLTSDLAKRTFVLPKPRPVARPGSAAPVTM